MFKLKKDWFAFKNIIFDRPFLLVLMCSTFLFLSNAQDLPPNFKDYESEIIQDMNIPGDIATSTVDPTEEKSSISEQAIRDSLNLDVGRFTPQTFEYYNRQNEQLPWKRTSYHEDRCYNDYIKCLISQTNLYHICAYSLDIKEVHNTVELASYCDLYMDNCRRRMRFWVGYKKGNCYWYDPWYKKIDNKVSGNP